MMIRRAREAKSGGIQNDVSNPRTKTSIKAKWEDVAKEGEAAREAAVQAEGQG